MPKRSPYTLAIVFYTVLEADDGPNDAKNGVICTEVELQKTLPHHADLLQSNVNFEKEQLIFVALGLHETEGFDVQIKSVSHKGEDDYQLPPLTEVAYREHFDPISVAFEKFSPTCPIHVIKTKKLPGEVVFEKEKKNQ